jgi:type VI protein secretion system component VasF
MMLEAYHYCLGLAFSGALVLVIGTQNQGLIATSCLAMQKQERAGPLLLSTMLSIAL